MRDEVLKMTGEEIEARLSQIKEELNVQDCDIDSLEAEVNELKEARKIKLDNEEKRKSMLAPTLSIVGLVVILRALM